MDIVVVLPDNKTALVDYTFISLETGNIIYSFYKNDLGARTAVSPDGKKAAMARVASGYEPGTGHNTIEIWNIDTKSLALTINVRASKANENDAISAISFSPDSRFVLAGGRHAPSSIGFLKLWNATNGQFIRAYEGQSEDVNTVAFSLDGRSIISSGKDGKVSSLGSDGYSFSQINPYRRRLLDSYMLDFYRTVKMRTEE